MDNSKLKDFADTLRMVNANKSGNTQGVAFYSNKINQRKLEEQARLKKEQDKLKAEKLQQQQDAFIKANPQFAQIIEMDRLFNLTPPAAKDRRIVLQNGVQYYADTGQPVLPNAPEKTPPKKTKSDYVVEILEKMRNNPDYELTNTDQRILDTISSTDPLDIYAREIRKNQVSKMNPQVPNISTGPVTVTTQKEFDDLPTGTTYIYNGTEYVKGK